MTNTEKRVAEAIAFLERDMPDGDAALGDLRHWVNGLGEGNPFPSDVDHSVLQTPDASMHRYSPRTTASENHGAILYLHGGAYVAGSALSHGSLAAHLAIRAGSPVYLLDYRKAPEHPYPAAFEDALAAYEMLAAKYESVAIFGDSAGGGLALATTCAIRDAGRALPSSLGLISPWVDLTLSGASHHTVGEADPMVSEEALRAGASAYANAASLDDPKLSPLFDDLAGLPPIIIQVGSRERLMDDSTALATKARNAGVLVSFSIWPGMVHVWHMFGRYLVESGDALDALALHHRTNQFGDAAKPLPRELSD